jgi:hypothetical protein
MAVALSPNLRLDVKFLQSADEQTQEYWQSASFAFEVLLSDVLTEQPSHIGDFMREWISNPKHHCLMTPHSTSETGLNVGDPVVACFYGEWHPATIRRIDGSTIDVVWDGEWSSSRLPASAVLRRQTLESVESVSDQGTAEQLSEVAAEETYFKEPTFEEWSVAECTKASSGVRRTVQEPSTPEPSTPIESIEDEVTCTWSQRVQMNSDRNALAPAVSSGPARAGVAQSPPTKVQARRKVAAEVQKFIDENGLDKRAAQALRSETSQIQKIVIEQGNCTNTHNPSSVVLSRINRASTGACISKSSTEVSELGPAWLESFIKVSNIDERASRALRNCALDVQEAVVRRGPLATARNPSAAVLVRIQDAEKAP